LPEVANWIRRRTADATAWTARDLAAAKGGTRVSVVLPARNEQGTVGQIVSSIRRDLVDGVPLVDELVVIDSNSTDATGHEAARSGATVVHQDEVLPEVGRMTGKGEALWKSLAVTTGDVLVFVDADLRNFSPSFVVGLLGPLLTDPTVGYVKAAYERPLITSAGVMPAEGGRVTELVARPLLNLHWPRLAGFFQPLAGEYGGRRSALERVPFTTGYGVELGLLIDLLDLLGLDALAQVDLGERLHSHQSTAELGQMAGQIMLTAWSRLRADHLALREPATTLTQFRRHTLGYDVFEASVQVADRPPMITIPGYVRARQALTGQVQP
jgi:glucosyl-3-phosphoglycerate synthase